MYCQHTKEFISLNNDDWQLSDWLWILSQSGVSSPSYTRHGKDSSRLSKDVLDEAQIIRTSAAFVRTLWIKTKIKNIYLFSTNVRSCSRSDSAFWTKI